MRQSAAHSRHWLLTASGARGVRDWCLVSGRWRSGRRQTDPTSGPRPPTQMRPFSLCYRCLQRRQSGVRLVQPQLESALVIAEWPASKPVPLRYAPGSAICLVAAARAPHGRHSRPRLPRPIGVYRGHEGDDNGQSIRAIGSALHLAYQQAAGAPDVALSSPTSASPWIEPLLRSSVCLEHQATQQHAHSG